MKTDLSLKTAQMDKDLSLETEYCINGKVRDVEMFVNYVNPRNSGTFLAAFFFSPPARHNFIYALISSIRKYFHTR